MKLFFYYYYYCVPTPWPNKINKMCATCSSFELWKHRLVLVQVVVDGQQQLGLMSLPVVLLRRFLGRLRAAATSCFLPNLSRGERRVNRLPLCSRLWRCPAVCEEAWGASWWRGQRQADTVSCVALRSDINGMKWGWSVSSSSSCCLYEASFWCMAGEHKSEGLSHSARQHLLMDADTRLIKGDVTPITVSILIQRNNLYRSNVYQSRRWESKHCDGSYRRHKLLTYVV